MTTPNVLDVTETSTTAGTSHDIAYPSTVNSGDLLIFFLSDWLNKLTGGGSGLTLLVDSVYTPNNIALTVYLKKATGSESGNVNFTTGASGELAARVYRIQSGTWYDAATLTDNVEYGTKATGNSSSPNPLSVTASWGADDNLFIAGVSAGSSGSQTYPSGWTNTGTTISGTGGSGNTMMMTADKSSTNASEDPGAFGYFLADSYVAQTFVVRGAAAASGSGLFFGVGF